MKIRHLVVLSAALMFTGSVWADEGEAVLKNKGCAVCHNMNNKTVGPSLKAIATKYSGDASAQAKLEAKVRSGGKGSFGAMEMPKQPASVSDADIKAAVSYILSIK